MNFPSDFKDWWELAGQGPTELWVLVFGFGFLFFAIWWDKKRHLLCVWEAGKQLKRLRRLPAPEKQLTLLRGLNPFVFEELLLTALKQRGHKITRNKRYTGDGGIDGQVIIEGQHYLIQAKRYSGYINQKDVRKFSWLCKVQGIQGLFIHTGKTGKASRAVERYGMIKLMSGTELLKMLTGERVQMIWLA